jgi:hypothetical protein
MFLSFIRLGVHAFGVSRTHAQRFLTGADPNRRINFRIADDSGSEVNAQQLRAGVADLNPVRQILSHSSSRTGRSRLSLRATTRLYALRP